MTDPVNRYVGQWGSCQTSTSINLAILTSWTVTKGGPDTADVVVGEGSYSTGPGITPCTGTPLSQKTVVTGKVMFNGVKTAQGQQWDRADIAVGGGMRRELLSVSGSNLQTSTDVTLSSPAAQVTRDAVGYPETFQPTVLARR